MSREICEYDNYPIPKCDPNLSPEERARKLRETKEELMAYIRKLVEEDKE